MTETINRRCVPMGKYWNEEIECMAHEDMKKLQSERLVKQVKHVWDNVPYYKKISL